VLTDPQAVLAPASQPIRGELGSSAGCRRQEEGIEKLVAPDMPINIPRDHETVEVKTCTDVAEVEAHWNFII
ncbi:hypothetical protein JZ751_014478, partial [Albula glossodonta]